MNLSRDFTLNEFTDSQTAARMGRVVAPDVPVVVSLTALCMNVLQPLRDAVGVVVVVSSGYRPDWLNAAIGGSKTSQHVMGEAADIKAIGIAPRQLCEKVIELKLPFDQLILEFDQWTHVSYSHRHRRQVLTARVINGKTTYLQGLV